MASTSRTLTNCYEQDGLIFPKSTTEWSDLSAITWADWSNGWYFPDSVTPPYADSDYTGTAFETMVIQIDDDLDTVGNRRPKCFFNVIGDISVQLKISDTGSFAGEETTINFVENTPVTYTSGRYYRWTLTVTDNSSTELPIISSIGTSYDTSLALELFDDLELSTLSTDSEGAKIVTTNTIGLVTNVQGTALQGTDYVVDDYIVTPTEQATYLRSNTVTVNNTNTTISTSVKKFGTGAFEFDGTAKLDMDDTTLYDETNNHTIEFWLNVDQLLSTTDGIYAAEQSPAVACLIGNVQQDGAGFRFVNQINGQTSGTRTDRTSVLNFDTWYHIAVVIAGTGATIYVDGTQDSANLNDSIVGGRKTFGGVFFIGTTSGGSADFDGYIDDFHITESSKYSGSFTAPTEAMTVDQNTKLLLNADDFTDNNGINYGTDKYIEDQIGGAVVIESKNPLTVKVVDYNGNTWDGTVDLAVRGFEKVTLTTEGVA